MKIDSKLQAKLFCHLGRADKLVLDNPEAQAELDAMFDLLWDADAIEEDGGSP